LLTEKRTMYCGEVRKSDVGRVLVLKGWVHRRRDHGGLIFIDLRDRTGWVQVVLNPEGLGPDRFAEAHSLRDEYVLAVRGEVVPRSPETVNSKIPTGEVEVKISEWEVLNAARPTPFKIDEFQSVSEEIRLRYRYLDLRRPEMQRNFVMRSKACQAVRRFLTDEGFLEVETPILTKSTPEGARDFLVPSRMSAGAFYALPQSPQLFKQLLMVSGYDRYFQIARCFRDEDFRANRQPEFTQIDIEMSFITIDDLIDAMERMVAALWKDTLGIEVPVPFRRMAYDKAMLNYGSDKPDLRFGLEIRDVSDVIAQGCEFKVFNEILENSGAVRALCLPGGASKYSNTALKPDGEFHRRASRECGLKGLAWFKVKDDGALESGITRFFTAETLAALRDACDAKPGDILFLVADRLPDAAEACGRLRLLLGRDAGLIKPDAWEFCWIVDFPMFEWDALEKRWAACHHPFTAPKWEDVEKVESDPGHAKAQAYDLSLNGEEIGGGSIRIHRRNIQEKVFKVIGLTDEEAQRKFGFLLEALSFGAPPHGGIAFGFDRVMMLILGEDSIRNVIPFPKTQSGLCLMTQAPSEVDAKQLKELHLRLATPPGGAGAEKPAT
jgi:aspartyl-tRNA synthetase